MAKGRPRKKPIESQKEPEQPKEDLVTPFEAANILNVSESTIKLWFDHGHLTGRGSRGHIRISRGSLFGPRIKKLISGPWG